MEKNLDTTKRRFSEQILPAPAGDHNNGMVMAPASSPLALR